MRASSRCALGGSARVLQGATSSSVRVAVTLDNWINGYLVTLGVDGDALQVTRAAHATPRQQGPLLADAMRSFTFELGEEPVEMSAFAVIFECRRWGGLVGMSCSAAAVPPPPPPRVTAVRTTSITQRTDYYGDEDEDTSSNSLHGGGSPADASSYGDQPARRPAAAGPQRKPQTLPPGGGGGIGMSAAIGFLLVLVTLGGVTALVLQRGDMLKELLSRARHGVQPRHPQRKQFDRGKGGDETESMVAANLDDEEALQRESRHAPARAAQYDEEPSLVSSAAHVQDIPLSLDDEDKNAPSVILGRPI